MRLTTATEQMLASLNSVGTSYRELLEYILHQQRMYNTVGSEAVLIMRGRRELYGEAMERFEYSQYSIDSNCEQEALRILKLERDILMFASDSIHLNKIAAAFFG